MEQSLLEKDVKIVTESQLLANSCGHYPNQAITAAETNLQQIEQQHVDNNMEESEENEDDVIQVNKIYNTMREIRLAAIEYGRRRKFAVSTLRSGARQLVLACKHSGSYRGTKKCLRLEDDQQQSSPSSEIENVLPRLPTVTLQEEEKEEQPNDVTEDKATSIIPQKKTRKKVSRKIQCPFQIRAKPIKGQQGQRWIVYKMDLEHNHPMAPDSKAYAQHRKLDQDTVNEIVDLMKKGQTNSDIVKRLCLKGVRNVVRKDIANLRQAYFNPNNNKVSASGAIIYQVESAPGSAVPVANTTTTSTELQPSIITAANITTTTDAITTEHTFTEAEKQALLAVERSLAESTSA